MALFNNLPIKKKLVTMSTVSCLVGIFLAGCAFLVFDIIQYRQGQAKGLQAIAQIIADQSNAALEFDDLRQANTNLSALSAISNINIACIYKQKSLFAEYYREQGLTARCPSNAIAPPPLWHEMSLSGVADVTLNQANLGKVIVQSDLPDLEIRLWIDALVTLLIIFGACLISFGMANNLHNRIIGPLLRLGETAKYFAEHKNYSVRAQIDSNDEIGQVAIAFNQMMTRIQRDNSELEKLSSAVQRSGSSVLITDNKGFVEYVNSRYLEVSGFSEDNVIGTLADIFDTARTQRGQHAELWHKVLSGENWHGEVRNRGQNGKLYWSLQSISSIKDEQDHIKHLVIVGEDVTELKASQQKVERMAFYDVLTGLENRRLFRDRVEQSLRAHHRYHHHLAIFFLDLDQFKRINDTLGHDAGDELLITVARRLRSSVREEDTVSRQGGDEFTLLLQNIETPENAERVARNILHALTKPITLDGKSLTITASIGITLAPDDADTFTSLMKQADLAMYKAKELGRNTYHFYTESINKRPESALALEFDLRQAYQEEQFSLFYQPQVRLSANHPSDMEIIGVEALLRWFHPQKGMVSPVDFIPIAEEMGLICDLGKWVLNEACAEAKRLALAGTPVRVAVNIAAQQLRDVDFIVSVKNALETNGLEAQLLEIEITESSVMDDIGKAISILAELRDLGVSVSVDDFGTGYSSLSYLRRLPVNSLKIDRSFVKDIPHNRSDTEITAAVIAMAHKLNLEVVAEGVETEEHVTFLLQNNCDFGQGFLFATPLPADQLTLLLAKTPQEVIPTAPAPLEEPNLAPQTRH